MTIALFKHGIFKLYALSDYFSLVRNKCSQGQEQDCE